MKFENTEVFNFSGAFRGLRNPLESWNKSDSGYDLSVENWGNYDIGEEDLSLAQKLINAGSDNSKFLRQIMVSVDITAPLYWWKEYDTYKVGTVANSTSTMHKLSTTSITRECFEFDKKDNYFIDIQDIFIKYLEDLRLSYLETQDKQYWRALIQLLPESWLQTRTCTLNYAVLRNIYFARRNHKLDEWSVIFVNWIKSLPYAKELICFE